MFIASRVLAAAVAVSVLIGGWILSTVPDDSFGTVLQSLADVKTVQLEITDDGKAAEEIWVKQPNRLRWNRADGTYRIARGETRWDVDEKANRAVSQAASYFASEDAGLDLLALFGLPEAGDREKLLASRPTKQVQRNGKQFDLYQMDLAAKERSLSLMAYVNVDSRLLDSIELRETRNGRLETIGRLKVVAVNVAVDEELFVVGDTLTEDGRIGKVADVQGIVSIRPVMHQRWTPVCTQLPIKPGDWLRTDVRGANAVSLRLTSRADVTIGPGSVVELVRPNQLRIASGEIKIRAGAPLTLIGPGDKKIEVTGTKLFRVQDEQLIARSTDPEKAPLWLRGFEGTVAGESTGTLMVKTPDGRSQPLSVGYHKVHVEIRDQIAQTVIEESFVNHTSTQTEGTFHFPLPANASISGFAMYMDDQRAWVEADVVEKQRAREIYEQLLREKTDPGLLEWAGGNIFKARVFPILPHREKRIKITYTQVLPLRGNRYHYSYGLQSDMLRENPLRELAIDVKLHSAVPLVSVKSPTHTSRINRTKHSAQVEFTAQEYTPTRDFEVVVETAAQPSDVVLIPHRRGTDGYFMLQVTPPIADGPATQGDSQRDVLPNGEPLDLLILADTSASIDSDGRDAQASVIGSLLSSLTPQDTFNLAACDVDCDWVFEKGVTAEEKKIETARAFLADRVSLGWSNLDRAMASAIKRVGPKTHVIYIGDGIVTGEDSDPDSFVKRLGLLHEGKGGTFHAVSVGSSYEAKVLRAISALGSDVGKHGSMRQISGEHGPQVAALELLGEITRPTIRNLKVELRNITSGRIYPEQLPNLPAGTQQILLGRYLPDGKKDQQVEVIISGTQAGGPIRLVKRVTLKNNIEGNSFLPRLWARMELDYLLEQGASQTIQDEIIALSEQFNIITPYTSLLVLETDADRERFGVKKRFRMRGGEEYFATGRDRANFELRQQQMKRAGEWRVGLRRSVLAQLSALGRDTSLFQQQQAYNYGLQSRGGYAGRGYSFAGSQTSSYLGDRIIAGQPLSFGVTNGSMRVKREYDALHVIEKAGAPMDAGGEIFFYDGDGKDGASLTRDFNVNGLSSLEGSLSKKLSELGDERFGDFDPGRSSLGTRVYPVADLIMSIADGESYLAFGSLGNDDLFAGSGLMRSRYIAGKPIFEGRRSQSRSAGEFDFFVGINRGSSRGRSNRPAQVGWLGSLFPHLPAAPSAEKPQPPKTPWPREARALAESLLRNEQLAALDGGLKIVRTAEYFDARWDKLTSRNITLALVSPKTWLIRGGGNGSQTPVQWCDAEQRAVFSKAFLLGRQRTATAQDLSTPPLDLSGYAIHSIEKTYQTYEPELRKAGNDRTLLVLTRPNNEDFEIHVLIDTARSVILQIENRNKSKVTSTTRFADFTQIADSWWAGRMETFDDKGRRTNLIQQDFLPLSHDALAKQVDRELILQDKVQFLREPLTTVSDAKRAIQAGKATFDDHLAMVLHFALSQRWEQVDEHLAQLGAQPGLRWVRYAVMRDRRRRDELKQQVFAEAAKLVAAKPNADEFFLANHLRSLAGVFETNEMLTLLDVVRPIYSRQEPHQNAMKQWQQQQINYLARAGQSDQVMQLRKQLAEQYPHDYSIQQQYAQALTGIGDHAAALAWLQRAIDNKDAQWHAHEEDSLRNNYCAILRSQGRYAELADYLADWTGRNPSGTSPYQQYLSALIRADREDRAHELIGQWLADGRTEDDLDPAVAARLSAAVSAALGNGYNLNTNRIDRRWLDPLAEVAMFFARHKTQSNLTNQIMGRSQFKQTDHCRKLRRQFAQILLAEIDTLPIDKINLFVNWIWPNDPTVEKPTWQRIVDRLVKRWESEEKPELRQKIAGTIIRILPSRIGQEAYLDFLRRQLAEGPKQYRASYANQLFNALLARPWTADNEDELFGLLTRLSDAEKPAQRLVAQVAALHRLTDTLTKARFDALVKQVEKQDKMTRTELREMQTEKSRAARSGLADRLRKAVAKAPDKLAPWFQAERLYLEITLNRDLPAVTEACWEALGPNPPKQIEEPDVLQRLNLVLQNRHLTMLANLAARKDAEKKQIDRLLDYTDRAIAANPKQPGWKSTKYQLLVALDRAEDLKTALMSWIRPDEPDNQWRVSLGYVLAEQGDLDEAVKQFLTVQTLDELGPKEYRTLADWYLVLGKSQEQEASLISAFEVTQENTLSNWLAQKLRPWQQREGPLPNELDKDVLRVFTALFQKASRPQNYLYRLRQFYQATGDFRLLEGLPEAVIGHTSGRVYPFLQGMTSVLSTVQDEATSLRMLKQLNTVRKAAKTDVDRRALDLLEMIIHRRCAELQNQPGEYDKKGAAAMRRAFPAELAPGPLPRGEARLLCDFLASLGQIAQPNMAAEQIRQLEILHRQSEPGSVDRLHLARQLAIVVFAYSQHDRAIALLQEALAERKRATGGILPNSANSALTTLVDFLHRQRHYARAESVLFEELKRPANPQQAKWLNEQLYGLYHNALYYGGQVSLGQGETLYRAVADKLRTEMKKTTDHSHRYQLIDRLCRIYGIVHEKKIADVSDSLRDFAFQQIPQILQQQTNYYESIARIVAGRLHDSIGARDGLAFLIERLEDEPVWFRYTNKDGWSQHANRLAEWRVEVKPLGDLEKRLLNVVLTELRRDLTSRRQRNRVIYHRHHNRSEYFWQEKTDDFARVAEEVLKEQRESSVSIVYIAEYLYNGLARHDRAIAVLFDADNRKVLAENGQSRLARFLHDTTRHGESIGVLKPLVAGRTDNLDYRIRLMDAYYHTKRQDELLSLLKETDEQFHQKNPTNQGVLAKLAAGCLENRLFEQSAAYFEKLIPLYRQTHPPRTNNNNNVLSDYLQQQARAYAGMGDTGKAVATVCDAIVCWSRSHGQRKYVLRVLEGVLRGSPDLDAFVARFDADAEEEGTDNPTIRKALGKVYFDKQQYAKAARQWALAVELQPNDTETHRQLVGCYDKLEDPEGAVRQLLDSVRVSPRAIELYKDLGARLEKLGQDAQVERAHTSIVEMMSTESESHTALAKIRETQDRWDEAIIHWNHVARIRALEPNGLIGLAKAQIHQKQWDEAAKTLRKLRAKSWPPRFDQQRSTIYDLDREILLNRAQR